jgi:hypothetical protein
MPPTIALKKPKRRLGRRLRGKLTRRSMRSPLIGIAKTRRTALKLSLPYLP